MKIVDLLLLCVLFLCFCLLVSIHSVARETETIERGIADKLDQILSVEFEQLHQAERQRGMPRMSAPQDRVL